MQLHEKPVQLSELLSLLPASLGAALVLAIFLWLATGRQLRDVVLNALVGLCDVLESLTTGWSSPPLPVQLPGPRGLPVLGYLPFLGKQPHKTLAALATEYGGRAFRLLAGSRRFVVISRIDMVRQLSSRYANELRGKPITFTTQQMSVGAHNDMLQRWKRRRAYTDAGIKQVVKATDADFLHEEVNHLMCFLATLPSATDVRHDVTLAAARVMYRLSYGRCPDETALEGLRHIVHRLPDYTTTVGSLSWFDSFPAWRLLRRSTLAKFIQFNRYASAFCCREKSRVSQLSNETTKSGTSLFEFFRQKMSRMTAADRARFALSESVLLDGLEDIIRAGTESASLVAQWFLLYIAAFPLVQQRMRQELENYAARFECPLTVEDLRALIYCRAAFAETCRFCCLNPFLKREITNEMEVDGTRLPRGTILLFNNWAINNDPQYWKNPDRFMPERFLTPDCNFDESKAALFTPFGFGKRQCIGIETGRAFCMLIATSAVQRFDVTLDTQYPDFDGVFGIGLAPKQYRLHFNRRSTN